MNDEIKKLWDKACWYYCNLEENEKSIDLFEQIIKLDPNNVDAYFWAAYASWEFVAQYERAWQLIKEAIYLDPERADLYILWSWLIQSTNNTIIDLNDIKIDIDIVKECSAIMYHAYELETTWLIPILYLLENNQYKIPKKIIRKALKEFKDVPKPLSDNPKDQMEWQYNFFITGLYCKEYKEKLEKYLEDNK